MGFGSVKFMGSKRWMLQNGLGDLIAKEVRGVGRFIDLFSGSGAVASHVATKYEVPVKAYDLQMFGAVLANAVLERKRELDAERLWADWYERAKKLRLELRPPSASRLNRKRVEACRVWCGKQTWTITKSYGGHYFSPRQAVWLDALRRTLPKRGPDRTVALAALIRAASECAASPGHTAQPFQPTRRAKPFLKDAWEKDVVRYCRDALSILSKQRAKVRGRAEVRDANEAAKKLIRKGDLVFVDPPYSGVHYSRFYHVLETLARGRCSEVSGTGRYPIPDERPWSRYSVKSESVNALDGLFAAVHARGGKAILTFPQRRCSNGLSGRKVTELASKHFAVERHWVAAKFSTLGGNNDHRDARHSARELMLVLRPYQTKRPKESAKSSLSSLHTKNIEFHASRKLSGQPEPGERRFSH